ncbi:MAG: DSD1 family PLP-dependent enzyme [Ktedonobacteraceae bacterium]
MYLMYRPRIGEPLEALDTPSLLVDLDLMESNIALMRERLQNSQVHIRPHLKTAKSPEIARLLLKAGAIGGCVSKVSEAEVMAEAGIEDLLITSEIVGQPKVARLIQLVEHHPHIKAVVDSFTGALALNHALQAIRKPLDVLIEIDVGQHRCGVQPGEDALELAQQLASLPLLRLRGVQGYEGHLQHVADSAEREKNCRHAMQLLTATVESLRGAGFTIDIVTTGGTGTAQVCASFPTVTEVQPGSFIFMDADYLHALGPVYAPSLTVLSTVISRPAPGRAIIDAGLKSLSTDSGMAEPRDIPALRYSPLGDEHGLLTWDDDYTKHHAAPEIGERVELIPSHCDTTINLFDTYYAHRKGTLEAIWPIAARGKVQ